MKNKECFHYGKLACRNQSECLGCPVIAPLLREVELAEQQKRTDNYNPGSRFKKSKR